MHVCGTYESHSNPSAAWNVLVCQYPVRDAVGAGHPQKVYSFSPGLEICIINGIRRFIARSANRVLCPCSEPLDLSQ